MTTRRSIIKGAVGASALAAPLTIPGLSALAQDGTPEAVEGPPPLPEGCELVASGLLSPRYIAIGEDGSVYVTEAGVGGDEEMFAPTEGTPEGTPEPQAPIATRGFSGQVTKVAPDGTVSVIASGLASYLIGGFEATGPAGIVLAGGLVWVAVGGPGPETPNVEPIEGQNSVVSIDEASGETTIVADLQTIEVEANPDGFGIDSNVYGMALGNDGLLYVADAGGNSISTVDPAAGGATLLAVTPGIEIPEDQAPPGGNPARAGANELDPVPCGVEAAADGGVHVSLLSGGPFHLVPPKC